MQPPISALGYLELVERPFDLPEPRSLCLSGLTFTILYIFLFFSFLFFFFFFFFFLVPLHLVPLISPPLPIGYAEMSTPQHQPHPHSWFFPVKHLLCMPRSLWLVSTRSSFFWTPPCSCFWSSCPTLLRCVNSAPFPLYNSSPSAPLSLHVTSP